jgi:hypothetical protein
MDAAHEPQLAGAIRARRRRVSEQGLAGRLFSRPAEGVTKRHDDDIAVLIVARSINM